MFGRGFVLPCAECRDVAAHEAVRDAVAFVAAQVGEDEARAVTAASSVGHAEADEDLGDEPLEPDRGRPGRAP